MFSIHSFRLRRRSSAVREPLQRTRQTAPGDIRGSERGVTVVEMLVASMILAVGVAGAATLFVASAESISVAGGEADATDIAEGELERVRALPYLEVGVSVTADGYVPVVDGRPTVTEAGPNRVEPMGTLARDGIDFRIERSVTWAQVGDDPEGYKIVVVDVRWDAAGLERTVKVQTGLYEDTAEP